MSASSNGENLRAAVEQKWAGDGLQPNALLDEEDTEKVRTKSEKRYKLPKLSTILSESLLGFAETARFFKLFNEKNV
jgi:hypothetical protein